MGKVRVRKETGKLQFDFFYQGVRCREQTLLDDTPENWKRMEAFMEKIDREIKAGTFSYETYFPNSSNQTRMLQPVAQNPEGNQDSWADLRDPAVQGFRQRVVSGKRDCLEDFLPEDGSGHPRQLPQPRI